MAEEPCFGWNPNVGLCETWAAASDAVKAYALSTASLILWTATGRRFGFCPVTARPCGPTDPVLYRTYPVVDGWGGFWGFAVAGGVVTGCPCSSLCACKPSEIPLPGPVGEITEVLQDGIVVDPSGYRLDGDRLVRLGGEAWPTSQNLALPTTEEGTFSVAYTRGLALPQALNDAAGIYACELALARTGGNCRLPNRIQTLTRQGVTVDLVSPDDYLEKGRTGLADVDQVIVALNPNGLASPPRVVSLDLPSFR